jgi:hypothetical protein
VYVGTWKDGDKDGHGLLTKEKTKIIQIWKKKI